MSKMLKLARKDDGNLVWLVNRWTLSKRTDPVTDAYVVRRTILLMIASSLLSAYLLYLLPVGETAVVSLLAGFIELICALVAMAIPAIVCGRNRSAFVNVREFCKAVSLVESSLGRSLGKDSDGWRTYMMHDTYRYDIGLSILTEISSEVKRLQGIAWRKKKAAQKRYGFFTTHKLLMAIGFAKDDHREYWSEA